MFIVHFLVYYKAVVLAGEDVYCRSGGGCFRCYTPGEVVYYYRYMLFVMVICFYIYNWDNHLFYMLLNIIFNSFSRGLWNIKCFSRPLCIFLLCGISINSCCTNVILLCMIKHTLSAFLGVNDGYIVHLYQCCQDVPYICTMEHILKNVNLFLSSPANVYLCSMKEILEKYKEDGLVYSQVHPTLPLTIYNYTDVVQWEGLWDEVTLQARALVVDDITGEIVARPFKKFFNLSEGRTKTTNEYEIWEKLDGSLIIAFYYYGDWVLASRGSFTSEQVGKAKEFFKDSLLNKDLTYCFEILYAENRIVCKYDYEGLVLTAAFNSKSGEEVVISGVTEYREARRFNFDTPLDTLHQIIDDNEEGYVIRFSNGERCKIKGAEYLRLHKAMSEMSTTAIWECLMNGTSVVDAIQELPDEFYQLVKDYEKELEQEYNQVEEEIFKQYISLVKDVDDKTFALSIENHPLKNFFFSLRNKKDVEKAIWKKIKPNFRKL